MMTESQLVMLQTQFFSADLDKIQKLEKEEARRQQLAREELNKFWGQKDQEYQEERTQKDQEIEQKRIKKLTAR